MSEQFNFCFFIVVRRFGLCGQEVLNRVSISKFVRHVSGIDFGVRWHSLASMGLAMGAFVSHDGCVACQSREITIALLPKLCYRACGWQERLDSLTCRGRDPCHLAVANTCSLQLPGSEGSGKVELDCGPFAVLNRIYISGN